MTPDTQASGSNPGRKRWTVCLALCCALFAFAFVAAPASCEWGLQAYVYAGLSCVALLFATPIVLRDGTSRLASVAPALGFAALGCAVWLGGLFIANVRIMCRLF